MKSCRINLFWRLHQKAGEDESGEKTILVMSNIIMSSDYIFNANTVSCSENLQIRNVLLCKRVSRASNCSSKGSAKVSASGSNTGKLKLE